MVIYTSLPEVQADIVNLRDLIARQSVVILRGLIDETHARQLVSKLNGYFDPVHDIRKNPTVVHGHSNYQRLDLGEYGGVARFMRTFFQFGWNKDLLGAQETFSNLASIRNMLMGVDLVKHEMGAKAYNASRIIQYPVGGGFMAGHTDTLAPQIQPARSATHIGNYVALLSLTKRGEHFRQGGAWISTPGGSELDLEPNIIPGDILLYDQQTKHGVRGIDIHEPIDTVSLSGRLVALSTPYPFCYDNL